MSKKKTLTSSDLIRQVTGQPVYRNYTVESVDEESRTVELAFSSEYSVERWFGYEVLDHSSGAVRMERFEAGASALVNHDWDDLVGVIESARVEKEMGVPLFASVLAHGRRKFGKTLKMAFVSTFLSATSCMRWCWRVMKMMFALTA
ncbi:hypothetical protein P4S64_18925 [Vibrio sp. M60_M31a]